MRKILILAAILPLLVSCGPGGTNTNSLRTNRPDVERLRANGKKLRPDVERLRADVEFIGSDECEGRLPFTRGADRATAYIAQQMEDAGLKPGGDGGTYFQSVPVAMIRTEAPGSISIKTPAGALPLRKGVDFTAFSKSMQQTIDIEDAELVFAGYGIVAPEYGKNDYEGITDPQNKIAVVLVNDPGLGTDGDYFRGDAMTYYGRWTYKLEEGARQGLKGVLIIHDDRGAGYGWSVVCANKVRYDLSEATEPVLPFSGWLSAEAAKKLLEKCGYDSAELYASAKQPDFKPFSLDSRLSMTLTNTIEENTSPNVVGYIKGKTDECIVCSAHWDHLGLLSTPVDGDSVMNGATDNGTGVAWLLETARLLSETGKLRRSVVFLSPTCEEPGLLGSQHYASHPLIPMEKTVAEINVDVIPLWGENNEVTVTGYGVSTLEDLLKEVARDHDRYVMADPDAYNGMFYRSDQLPFMRKGVPALFAKGWSDSKEHGKQWSEEMIRRYWAEVYHKPCDETHPDSDDYSGLIQDVELFADLILRLANSKIVPEWYPGAEFHR